MKKTFLILTVVFSLATTLFFVSKVHSQQINAGQSSGSTIDQKIRNAAANCQPSFPCVIFIPPELGVLPKGAAFSCASYPPILDPAGVTGCASGQSTLPGGLNSQIQFNNGGIFAGDSALTYSTGGNLTVGNGTGTPNISLNDGGLIPNPGSLIVFRAARQRIIAFSNFAGNGSNTIAFNASDILAPTGGINVPVYQTASNCSSSASPAVCGTSAAGSVVIAAAATTVTVNTTAITANSQPLLTRDDSLGTKLGVTCNTATVMGEMKVTARVPGTSFTITVQTAPAINPGCIGYVLFN